MRGILLFLLAVVPAAAQDFTAAALSRHVLTNEGIITLAKAGFDELFIVQRIHTSRTRFDTSVDGLVALKQAGVSEELIDYMAVHDIRVRPFPAEGEAPVIATTTVTAAAPASTAMPQGKGTLVLLNKHWWGYRWERVNPTR
jgi:hypothetical protein